MGLGGRNVHNVNSRNAEENKKMTLSD